MLYPRDVNMYFAVTDLSRKQRFSCFAWVENVVFQPANHPSVPGHHNSATDRGGGLRRVHLQGLGEQRSGRLPRHHGGVGAAAAAEAQQLPPGPEESLAAPLAASARSDWANGPSPGHEKGPGQELHAHVETKLQKSICTYFKVEIYNRRSLFIVFFSLVFFFFLHCRGVKMKEIRRSGKECFGSFSRRLCFCLF